MENTYTDLIGISHMYGGLNFNLTMDRSGNINSAMRLNYGFRIVPAGIYFNGDFTITGWVKIYELSDCSRFFDFGSGPGIDCVFVSFALGVNGPTYLHTHQGNYQTLFYHQINGYF